jgi:hypothetical protein
VEDNQKFLNSMIRCNVDSVANLTQIVLPGLVFEYSYSYELYSIQI